MIETGIRKLNNPEGLHIVLESIPLSEIYFHEYYLYLREILLGKSLTEKNKSKNLCVTSMTASNYHSLAMFLHSSDLSE